jgi:hypothetical protein
MALFEWLFGRHSDSDPAQAHLSDPAQAHLDELLPRVSRIRAVVVPTTFPYAIFPIPGRVRPFPGGGIPPKGVPDLVEILIDTVDPEAIAAFRKTLGIVERSSSFGCCSCLGCPTVELYSGDKLVARIGIQHGQAICWDRWKYAAELSDDQAFNGWLMTHGVQPALVDVLNHTAMLRFGPGSGPSGKCRYLRG